MKKKGVLPSHSDRKKIAEIKKILPQLAVESVGKDKTFWLKKFEKDKADIILPDFKEQLLDFIETPDDTYNQLKSTNKLDAFIKKTEDSFGFIRDASNPLSWQFEFVSHLCVVELFVKTNTPSNFPLRGHLPPNDKFDSCVNLIRDIRDNRRHQQQYKDIVSKLEEKYKSSINAFAEEHAFDPDIETIKLLDEMGIKKLNSEIGKIQTKEAFIQEILSKKDFVDRKAQNFWSQENEIIEWGILKTIYNCIESINTFESEFASITDEKDLIWRYSNEYYKIDMSYRTYLEAKRSIGENLENFGVWVERLYLDYLNKVNSMFSEYLSEKNKWELQDIKFQGDFLREFEKLPKGGRALIFVDAMRYELGKELEARLKDEYEVTLNPMYAQIPTKTQIGMTFLLSPSEINITIEKDGISVQTEEGLDLSFKANRVKYLKSKLRDVDTINLNQLLNKKISELKDMKNQVVVFSTDIDKAGETGGIDWLRFFNDLLQDIAKGVRILIEADFSEIHIVTDHGFLAFNDPENKFKALSDNHTVIMKDKRFLIGENITNPNLVRFDITGLKDKSVYFLRGIHYFKSDTFYHGGISLHEAIIPYLTVKRKIGEPTKVNVNLEIKEGIYNKIFKVMLKPDYKKIAGIRPRTVEVACIRDGEIISNKPAVMVEYKEEWVRLKLIDTKYLSKGSKIKIIAQDQETLEILSEIDAEIIKDLTDETL